MIVLTMVGVAAALLFVSPVAMVAMVVVDWLIPVVVLVVSVLKQFPAGLLLHPFQFPSSFAIGDDLLVPFVAQVVQVLQLLPDGVVSRHLFLLL